MEGHGDWDSVGVCGCVSGGGGSSKDALYHCQLENGSNIIPLEYQSEV